MSKTASKPWYQFTVLINPFKPENCQVIFPEDPRGSKAGNMVDSYLRNSGMVIGRPGNSSEKTVIYVVKDSNPHLVSSSNLQKLQEKFAVKGAVLQIVNPKAVVAPGKSIKTELEGYITQEEFDQAKKYWQQVEQEFLNKLQALEAELKQLEKED